jgi:hypothetical protein
LVTKFVRVVRRENKGVSLADAWRAVRPHWIEDPPEHGFYDGGCAQEGEGNQHPMRVDHAGDDDCDDLHQALTTNLVTT